MDRSLEKRIVEQSIDQLTTAIKYIGDDGMQRIYISANSFGVDEGMKSGDYINLSNDQFACRAIKNLLKLRLRAQKIILNDINKDLSWQG